MKNHYETVFILTPVLSEDQVKETVQKFKDFLTEKGAEIIWEENWGLKKLAYPIQHKKTGFYYLMEFKADPELIQRLDLEFRRDERVMRHLVVKLDKYAAEWAEKRRKKIQQKQKA
ncbi:MAG: 30S ribosomal protein S6 [Chlorobi bacterium]|nr:30S ribosomal protein S6 [Chlorobiota bacterium]